MDLCGEEGNGASAVHMYAQGCMLRPRRDAAMGVTRLLLLLHSYSSHAEGGTHLAPALQPLAT